MNKSRITRRDFIRRTAGAAGATFAARTVLLEPLFGAAAPRAVPAGDRVRFGIIGVGMQGTACCAMPFQYRAIECVAACDLYDGRHEVAHEIVGKPIPTTRRYQELLDNKEIDCIINATPDHWHRQIVVDCCNAGKDVYCEKPMTHTVERGLRDDRGGAEEQADRAGRQPAAKFGDLYARRRSFLPRARSVTCVWWKRTWGATSRSGAWEYPIPPDLSPQNLDWDTWLGTAPKVPFNPYHFQRWRCWQAYGSGVAGTFSCTC